MGRVEAVSAGHEAYRITLEGSPLITYYGEDELAPVQSDNELVLSALEYAIEALQDSLKNGGGEESIRSILKRLDAYRGLRERILEGLSQ